MPQEIERRFLVCGDLSTLRGVGEYICQGYLPARDGCTARVRIVHGKAFLTKKGRKTGCCRLEVEREISLEIALRLLRDRRVGEIIEKTRYRVDHQGFCWEVDVFHGTNTGLVIAEIELEEADAVFPLPDWIGEEITDVPRYSNSALSRHPVRAWRQVA